MGLPSSGRGVMRPPPPPPPPNVGVAPSAVCCLKLQNQCALRAGFRQRKYSHTHTHTHFYGGECATGSGGKEKSSTALSLGTCAFTRERKRERQARNKEIRNLSLGVREPVAIATAINRQSERERNGRLVVLGYAFAFCMENTHRAKELDLLAFLALIKKKHYICI